MASFLAHGGKCPACRYEYEIEIVTKSVVRGRAKMLRTPVSLIEQVAEQLEREGRSATPLNASWWDELLSYRAVKPALAFGFACILLLLFLSLPKNPDATSTSQSSDVITQSLSNYQSIVRGDIKPQVASNLPENLVSFFAGKTDFPVLVPKMKGCSLLGGVSNEYAGIKLAHVMYQRGGEVVYMYQTCWETVIKGEKLNLPQEAKDELLRTGWFTQSDPGGCTVVLWRKDRTLCAAVAHMDKDDLISCLTAGEGAGDTGW
jgi:hypothetical protein